MASVPGPGGQLKVFASWNGSTAVTQWRVVGGASSAQLATLGAATKQGFETTISLPRRPAFLEVEALGKDGQILASSDVVATN